MQSHRGVINLQLVNNNPKALGFIDSTLSMKPYFESVQNTDARGVFPKKKGRPVKRRRGMRQEEWSLQVQDSRMSDHGEGPVKGGPGFRIQQQPESIGEIKEKYHRQQMFERPTLRFGQRIRASGDIPKSTIYRGYFPSQMGPSPKLVRSHFSESQVQETNIKLEDDLGDVGRSVISGSISRRLSEYQGVANLNRDFSSLSFKMGRGEPVSTMVAHPHLRTAVTTPLPLLDLDYTPPQQRIRTIDNTPCTDLMTRGRLLRTHQRPASLDVDSTRGFRKPFPRPEQRQVPAGPVDCEILESGQYIKTSYRNYLEPVKEGHFPMCRLGDQNFKGLDAFGNERARAVDGLVFNDRVFSVYKGVYPRGRRLISKGFSDADDRRHSTRTMVMTRCKSKNEHSQV